MQNPSEMLLENSSKSSNLTETHTLWLAFYARAARGFYRAHSTFITLSQPIMIENKINKNFFSLPMDGRTRSQQNALSVRDVDALIYLAGGQLSQTIHQILHSLPIWNPCSDLLWLDIFLTASPGKRSSFNTCGGNCLQLAYDSTSSFCTLYGRTCSNALPLQQGWLPPLLTTHLKVEQIFMLSVRWKNTPYLIACHSMFLKRASNCLFGFQLPRQLKPIHKNHENWSLSKTGRRNSSNHSLLDTSSFCTPATPPKSGYHLYDAGMVNLCLRIQKAKANVLHSLRFVTNSKPIDFLKKNAIRSVWVQILIYPELLPKTLSVLSLEASPLSM